MSEPIKVKIAELSDRYLVLNAETGDNMDDKEGFTTRYFAEEWALLSGFDVVEGGT